MADLSIGVMSSLMRNEEQQRAAATRYTQELRDLAKQAEIDRLASLGWHLTSYPGAPTWFNDSLSRDYSYYLHRDLFDNDLVMEAIPNDHNEETYHERFKTIDELIAYFK